MAISEKEIQNLTQRIPVELLNKVRIMAAQKGLSVNAYINKVLENEINETTHNDEYSVLVERIERLESAVFKK